MTHPTLGLSTINLGGLRHTHVKMICISFSWEDVCIFFLPTSNNLCDAPSPVSGPPSMACSSREWSLSWEEEGGGRCGGRHRESVVTAC